MMMSLKPLIDLAESWKREASRLDKMRHASELDLEKRDVLFHCAAELERKLEEIKLQPQ